MATVFQLQEVLDEVRKKTDRAFKPKAGMSAYFNHQRAIRLLKKAGATPHELKNPLKAVRKRGLVNF